MTTFRQKLLRLFYPIIRNLGKSGKNGTVLNNEENKNAVKSFHALQVTLNTGKAIHFSTFSGKKVMIVNTASDCGYTGQYAELEDLYKKYKEKLIIIAFPANDFAGQEKENDANISAFCQLNYGVTFPVAKKSVVIKNSEQNPVFKWLTDASLNGWNDHAPDWNFSKYLIDEKGNLMNYFGPSVSPLEKRIIKSME